MKLDLRLFATLKARVGSSTATVEIDEPATVADVLAALIKKHPSVELSLGTLLISVNQEYAERTQPVYPKDDIALFPPVSGG